MYLFTRRYQLTEKEVERKSDDGRQVLVLES